jgi:hypothetical protein
MNRGQAQLGSPAQSAARLWRTALPVLLRLAPGLIAVGCVVATPYTQDGRVLVQLGCSVVFLQVAMVCFHFYEATQPH